MITVHHLENSRSQRILWLLEELGVPYEVERYARDAKTSLAPRALKEIHPLGKSPVVTEDGLTIAESGAIVEHLIERHGGGRLVPAPGSPEHVRYRYWLHAAEGSFMPLFVMTLVFAKTTQAPVPWLVRPITRAVAAEVGRSYLGPSIEAALDLMEAELGRSRWFAGDELSGADIQMMMPVEAAEARTSLGNRPRLRAFLGAVRERPAYRRALERGGPYGLLSA